MPENSSTRDKPAYESDLLLQLSRRWGKRVAVKKDELDLDGHFDPELPDFPEHLVPFSTIDAFAKADREARQRILAASWIAYNMKTTAIEDELILPACRLMLEERVPVRKDEAAVAALHQTIIDEHYHILMCHNAVGVTRRRRALESLRFDPGEWPVVIGREKHRVGLSGLRRDLADIAFALAAETTINAFLSGVSSDFDIQPMNRITVDMHRRDESGHAVIFRELVIDLYRELAPDERDFFRESLASGLSSFGATDVASWVTVAAEGELRVTPEEIVAADRRAPAPRRDTGPLRVLLDELGISRDEREDILSSGRSES